MNVRIQTAPGNEPRAHVTVQVHMNSTVDHLSSGMLTEGIDSSKVLTLISLTDDQGVFWDGTSCFTIDNDDGWITSLVEGIELY